MVSEYFCFEGRGEMEGSLGFRRFWVLGVIDRGFRGVYLRFC